MRYLIVSDVFGRTKALEQLASELSASVDIFDPYHSQEMGFENETDAYEYFIKNVGFEKYAEELSSIIQRYSEKLCLIGFSVGASAIWTVSSQKKLTFVSEAICFYGSQIRKQQSTFPQFPVRLIFPAAEKHFSDLILALSTKEHVAIIKTSYLHGFMNSHSENFNQSAYKKYIQYLNKC